MRLYIATPSYDGKVTLDYCTSLVKTVKILEGLGIEITIGNKPGDCYIPKARNNLVRNFLETDCTHILFIDADVGWDATKTAKVVQSGYDICLGAYPMKLDYEKYPIGYLTDNDKPIMEGDYLRINMGPTGFMCIKREVFDALDVAEYMADDGHKEKDYFKCGVFQGRWWGEDSDFCRLVISAGFEMWCYTDIDFKHTGVEVWEGNCKRKLCE